jgi:steroid 5-alpha reductase family enzyme
MLWWMVVGSSASTLREMLVLALLLFWATRLTCHWAYYWPGLHHEDWRYGMLREQAGRNAVVVDLMGVHVFPTIQVFLGMLPVYAVTVLGDQPLNVIDGLAALVMFAAISLQMTADVQLHAFAAQAKPGDTLETGLWSRSRHPNYLGEIGMWVGLAIFGLAAYPQGAWWVGLGALAMILMFRYASIPMMEKRSLARRPEYADTMARIPMLLPRLRNHPKGSSD